MTAKQAKALSALLNNLTQERAAAAADIGISTLKRYLADPDFQAEYQKAMSKLIEGAATQAKQGLSPALSCLREIVNDSKKSDMARIQAARSLLEYGLRNYSPATLLAKMEPLAQVKVKRASDYRWSWCEDSEAGSVPEGWMLRKVPQITAGKVFGSFAFVGSTAVDLGDRFRARSVTAHPVGDIGYSTHGWKLAREVA